MKKLPILFFSIKPAMLCFILFIFITNLCSAQFTKLHDFNGAAGANPYGKLLLVGHTLYGLTLFGGTHDSGCMYSVDTNGNNYRDLHDFSGAPADGSRANGGLTLIGTTLFGMTNTGGASTYGTIFSIDTNGNNYKVLLNFDNVNSSYPWEGFITIGNTLYGTGSGDDVINYGNIFSIDTDGTHFRNIYSFTGHLNGADPVSKLTLSGNKFYGVTSMGGTEYAGITYSIDTNGGNFKILYNLATHNTGYNTNHSLTLAGGKLFGTEENVGCGRPSAYGTVSSVDTDGSDPKSLFCFNGLNGAYPDFTPTVIGNKLYGMSGGGNNADSAGFIFSIDTSGRLDTVPNILFVFNGANGAYPRQDFTISGSTFYGVTYSGGSRNVGVIYKYTTTITTGINNLQQPEVEGVKVYPNPSNGVFEVKSEEIRDNSTVEVYNILGERIYSATLNIKNSTFNIDLSSQRAGIYLYRVTAADGSLIGEGKLVLEK